MPRKGKKKKQKTSSSTKTAASEKLQQQTLEELQKKVTESPSKVQPQDQLQQAVASTSQQKVFTSPPLQGIWAIRQQKLLASQSPPEGQLQKASHDISIAGSSKQVQTSKLESTNFQLKLTDKISFTQFILHHNMIPNRVHPEKGGLIGQKNKVMTNMYKIIFHDASIITAIHYDVTIKPMSLVSEKDESKKKEFELPKALCRNIFEQCRKKHFYDRYPAYDGKKKVFSAKNLPFGNSMMDVFKYRNVYGKSSQYQIILKKMGNIDLSWIKNFKPGLTNIDQTALQILDTIICHATQSRFVNVSN
ncbi:hypothetical protein PUN28_008880 [Cardiocondyla obscurior]|uniref:Protein argonaute N-terminal domain-containing protein n=1 Tax=Cardiocondyla obscurior TaxID=286306 RepID=A0AAW2FPC8_9HYME